MNVVNVHITIIRGNDKAAETRFRKYCGKLAQGRGIKTNIEVSADDIPCELG